MKVVAGRTTIDIEPGFMFLAAAAAECGVYPKSQEPHGIAVAPQIPPWKRVWSIFPDAPDNCDKALLYSTVFTCISDKLEALSEAIEPTRWDKVAHLDGQTFSNWDLVGEPWIIPPMAPESRVVVRDLARYALSQVAMLETIKIGDASETCSELYAYVIEGDTLTDRLSLLTFGTPVGGSAAYPSLTDDGAPGNVCDQVTQASAQELARERLLVIGNNLRVASRLLESSIRSSVKEDTSEAERRRAMATDLVRSNEAAWGLSKDGSVSHRFGTYGHALKVLHGRMELGAEGSGMEEPACGGIDAADLVSVVNGAASKLRPSFPKIITPGQQEAVCMVESLGLVLPDVERAEIDALRDALKAQAVEHAAAGAGIDTADSKAMDAFRTGSRAQSVRATIDEMADGDLRLALKVTAHEYGMLVDEPLEGNAKPECGENGLQCAEHVADLVESVGGIALEGGIPKADLTVAATARSALVSASSQCAENDDEVQSAYDALGAEHATRISQSDPFALAQAFGKRLVVLRELASEIGDEEVRKLAGVGAAEVGAWAGRTQVAMKTVPDGTGRFVQYIDLTIAGIVPADVGAWEESQLEDQFVVVFGTPADADCAAGLRESCTDAMLERRNTEPVKITRRSLNAEPSLKKRLGADGAVLELRFDANEVSALGRIMYPAGGPARPPKNLVYVIQKHAPDAGMGRGKVIAALPIRRPNDILAMAISPERDYLSDLVVGCKSNVDGVV